MSRPVIKIAMDPAFTEQLEILSKYGHKNKIKLFNFKGSQTQVPFFHYILLDCQVFILLSLRLPFIGRFSFIFNILIICFLYSVAPQHFLFIILPVLLLYHFVAIFVLQKAYLVFLYCDENFHFACYVATIA